MIAKGQTARFTPRVDQAALKVAMTKISTATNSVNRPMFTRQP